MLRSKPSYPSWGLYPPAEHVAVCKPSSRDKVGWRSDAAPNWLPRGQGRSYGDVCLNPGGGLIDTRGLDRYISFDVESGLLQCEAGVTLADVIRLFLGQGWFPAVTPGTKFVTVGGAVANDVHGKNHHRVGSFGNIVTRISLLRSDGSLIECSPSVNSEWFAATVGGMGLTGLIVSVEFQLRRVANEWIVQESLPFRSIGEFLALSRVAEGERDYVVAWVDCFSGRKDQLQGVLFSGDHADANCSRPVPRRPDLTVPFTPPISPLSASAVRVFNHLYRWSSTRSRGPRLVPCEPFFYPLDAVLHWNRIYGPGGFQQYQCVIPPETEAAGLAEVFKEIRRAGLGSPLAVLKRFGTVRSPGLCSFPRPGTTLALDFPMREPATTQLFARLDQIVVDAGGRLYPAKDGNVARTGHPTLFNDFGPLVPFVDPALSSGLWRRVRAMQS
jgi:FAD/FMN-containing dehydrogenase